MDSLLRRSVRFAVNGAPTAPGPNGYAGSPPLRGLGRFFELRVDAVGGVDARSGYLVNIRAIDRAVRERVLPLVERACDAPEEGDPARLLREALEALAEALPVQVRAIELALSPYHALAMETADTSIALLRVRFDFSAAHRLHVTGWSDDRNRECFGKCNNPSGHGHNYQLEPTVEVPAGMGPVDVRRLEQIVQAHVIERFDHKHLNIDTAEFAEGSGLIPSVENIARVCFDLLEGPIAALGRGARLRSVRVWETDRTSSEYPA